MARDMRRELTTGLPSSLKPMHPAPANSAMSASSLPALSLVTQPTGRMVMSGASLAAMSLTWPTVAASSSGGMVLGMQHTVVYPPRAAAEAPEAMVSLFS